MPSDSNEDLLYEPSVSHLHRALRLSPASNGAHSRSSLATPAGSVSYLVGSKRKLYTNREQFWGGKVKKTQPAWMLGVELGKGGLVFGQAFPSQTSSGYETRLNFFLKNITVMVVERLNSMVLAG